MVLEIPYPLILLSVLLYDYDHKRFHLINQAALVVKDSTVLDLDFIEVMD